MTLVVCLIVVVLFLAVACVFVFGRSRQPRSGQLAIQTRYFTVRLKDVHIGLLIMAIGVIPLTVCVALRIDVHTVRRSEKVSVLGLTHEVLTEEATARAGGLEGFDGARVDRLVGAASEFARKNDFAQASASLELALAELVPVLDTAAMVSNNLSACALRLDDLNRARLAAQVAVLLDGDKAEYSKTLDDVLSRLR